jgi:cation diffusion facilitator CzcD-associated flavoprotein CzcO
MKGTDLLIGSLQDTRLEPSREVAPKSIKQICVIGAGAAGIAALKVIVDTPQYKSGTWRVVAFEARNKVGGVW